jgi:hypothetical protein
MTHVYQRHGVRMVSFNKSGHKSIVQSFMTMPDGQDSTKMIRGTLHGGMRQTPRQVWHEWPDPLVVIAFFRHPLARVAAVWNHLFRDRMGYTPLLKFGFTEDMIFREFVRHLLTIEENDEMDLHLMPQARAYSRCHSGAITQRIYRLDEIATVWPQMCTTWGLQCRREPFHHNSRADNYPAGKPWTHLWHDLEGEALELILGMYSADFDLWSNLK